MTGYRRACEDGAEGFNPHTHEGCDIRQNRIPWQQKVSIHTPTKGVTRIPWQQKETYYSFNPHTHEGCDYPRRAKAPFHTGFNPHTHEGCDIKARRLRCSVQVSIHTPTKGVTMILKVLLCSKNVSIHTPTKGVTLYYYIYLII